ncbi:MAG: T9SS type A sorting domain-containing protein [Candidatus Cloacimonetes bacterium]|nr:T9SS type A sorting domain-containing protein [Candidatus Cloacimonadota bacterium]
MRKNIFLISMILIITGLSAEWIEISENSNKKLFDIITSDLNNTQLKFTLNGYDIETIETDGESYQKISFQNEGKFLEVGKPSLPRFSKLIAIPNTGNVSLEISNIEDEIITEMDIYPCQPLQNENEKQLFSFRKDTEFYSGSKVFPLNFAELDSPAILRDHRIVNVTINPFQYNPKTKELRIIKNMDISVNCSGNAGINAKTTNRKVSRSFSSLYSSSILNYGSVSSRNDDIQHPCYLFIYPDDASVESNLQYLLDWKHQKGFEVVAVSTLETGTTLNSIKAFIQDAYDNWENPPEFICLVGDAGGNYSIPTGHLDGGPFNGEGDQFYTLLEGDDILADVFLGRLSFNSITELQTIISKILHYEKEPYLENTNWYDSALLVGDPTYSGPSCIDTKQSIKEMIDVNAPNISCTEVYDTSQGSWVSQMNNSLNNGVSYFNYRGFANMSGWDNYYIDNLTNGFMLPVVVALTCNTGNFEGTIDCISERFLKAGSPSTPNGAIAAICTATGLTHTCFNNIVDAGIFYGIFSDNIYHMGGALNRGKLNLYINYPGNPSNHVNQFSYWNNLMGDPGMEIWTGIPQEMVVTCNSQIPTGTNFLEVNIQDINGFPLENAWVTALQGDDEIFASDFTNADGNIFLPIDASSIGEVNLTVTKHNFIPHLGSFDIIQDQFFVNVDEVQIDDDNSGTSSGNNNGNINPGEDIELMVSLMNNGTSSVNSVSATISSESEFVTITDDYESYGTIAPGNSVFSSDDFDITIHPDALNGTIVELNILIEDSAGNTWFDKIYLTIEGAHLVFDEYMINDTNNGILDPGETAECVLTIENIGTETIDDVYGIVSCSDNRITIIDSAGYFGTVSTGGTALNSSDPFEFTANMFILPGTQISMNIHLYNSEGYNDTIDFILEIGEVLVTDPLGPDAYGYYCYDDEDISHYKVPTYQWIEIDPTYGGSGTLIPLTDYGNMGDSDVIDLPFDFQFYGENYTSITVCSNGWISPGITEMLSFMNWNIPGPLGPSPIIAAFWDDLRTGSGGIYYYYNETTHYFVIEWSHLQNEYNNAEETFQIILYDQTYYPTSNGDNEILMQYKVVNNIDQGVYGSPIVSHGQYATVGLEDQTGTIGLEYTYNDNYPTAAKPLENEMAILFTSPPIHQVEPVLVFGGVNINDANGNGIIDYAENIDIDIILNNLGEEPATGLSSILTCSDQYITLIENSSNYNNIAGGSSGLNLTPFNFDVAENCPDGHPASFLLSITGNEDNWNIFFSLELNAPKIEVFNIFIDDGNNHILDPGETCDLHIQFINNGGSDAFSVVSSLSLNDPYISLNNGTFDIGSFNSGTIETAVFNITAGNSAPIQYEISIDWNISAEYNYENNGNFPFFISQVPVSVTENFDSFPPDGWCIDGSNWILNNSNLAGGTIPEACFIYFPQTSGTQRLISMPINTLGSIELELEFKHALYNIAGNYTIGVETTSNGTDWNTLLEIEGMNFPATTEILSVTTPDVGSSTFQFAFVFNGDTENINGWLIDDVILTEVEIFPHGYIAGNVSLSGGPGNIEEVIISAGGIERSPDSDGNYSIPVPQGIYDVSASLPGYITSTVEDVSVTEWETTSVNFILEETTVADPPENLVSSTYFNDVTLEWDIPGSNGDRDEIALCGTKPDKDRKKAGRIKDTFRNRSLLGYKIYRDGEEIAAIDDFLITTYSDAGLDAGEYNYYVTAIYDGGESSPSNIEVVIIILPPPTDLIYTIYNVTEVVLQWTAPTGGESRNYSGYNIYRNDMLLVENCTQLYYIDQNLTPGTYTYYVTARYGEYESEPSNEVEVEITDADDMLKPIKTELGNNYPNPFNLSGTGRCAITTISFSLNTENTENTELMIYNLKGQKVKTLINEQLPAGNYSVVWDGKDNTNKSVSSGIYLYRMKTKNYSSTKKMMILK